MEVSKATRLALPVFLLGGMFSIGPQSIPVYWKPIRIEPVVTGPRLLMTGRSKMGTVSLEQWTLLVKMRPLMLLAMK